MKKAYKILTAIAMALLIVSCGGRKDAGQSADSDSVAVEEEVEKVDSITYCFTPQGLGPIQSGDAVTQIPDTCAQLFTRKGQAEVPMGNGITFFDGGEPMFTVIDFSEGTVDLIYLESRRIKVEAPGADIALGDSFLNVLTLPGVEAMWIQEEDGSDGKWYWNWNGIFFGVDPSHLTQSLSSGLYDGDNQPTRKDFDESIRIGFIGNGVP